MEVKRVTPRNLWVLHICLQFNFSCIVFMSYSGQYSIPRLCLLLVVSVTKDIKFTFQGKHWFIPWWKYSSLITKTLKQQNSVLENGNSVGWKAKILPMYYYCNNKKIDYKLPSWFLNMYILAIGEKALHFIWQFKANIASSRTASQLHRALPLNWHFN